MIMIMAKSLSNKYVSICCFTNLRLKDIVNFVFIYVHKKAYIVLKRKNKPKQHNKKIDKLKLKIFIRALTESNKDNYKYFFNEY